MLSQPVEPAPDQSNGNSLPPASMPVLSMKTQEMFDTMDVDGQYFPWQIPIIHKPQFDELIQKGYLVPDSRTVVSADGQRTGTTSYYVFAEAIRNDMDNRMFR